MGMSSKYKGRTDGLHKSYFNGHPGDPGSAAGKGIGGGGQAPVPRGNAPLGAKQSAVPGPAVLTTISKVKGC